MTHPVNVEHWKGFIRGFEIKHLNEIDLKELTTKTLNMIDSKSVDETGWLHMALKNVPLERWIQRYSILGDDPMTFGFYASLMLAIMNARGPENVVNYEHSCNILLKLAYMGRHWNINEIELLMKFVALD